MLLTVLCASFFVLLSFNTVAADDRLRGFSLGSSLNEAINTAEGQGLSVTPSEHFAGMWNVKGTDITLYVCQEKVLGINVSRAGKFDDFVDTFERAKRETQNYEPELQVLGVDSGVGPIRTIDTRFPTADGGIKVQLQTVNGEPTLTEIRYLSEECNLQDSN